MEEPEELPKLISNGLPQIVMDSQNQNHCLLLESDCFQLMNLPVHCSPQMYYRNIQFQDRLYEPLGSRLPHLPCTLRATLTWPVPGSWSV